MRIKLTKNYIENGKSENFKIEITEETIEIWEVNQKT